MSGPPMLPALMSDEQVERIQKRALLDLVRSYVSVDNSRVEQVRNHRNDSYILTVTTRVEVSGHVLERSIPQRETLTLAEMEATISELLQPLASGSRSES